MLTYVGVVDVIRVSLDEEYRDQSVYFFCLYFLFCTLKI